MAAKFYVLPKTNATGTSTLSVDRGLLYVICDTDADLPPTSQCQDGDLAFIKTPPALWQWCNAVWTRVANESLLGATRAQGQTGEDGEDIWSIPPITTITALGGYPGGTANFLRADGTFASPGAASVPDIALSLLAPAVDETITAGYSAVVVRKYTIASSKKLTIGNAARMRIL